VQHGQCWESGRVGAYTYDWIENLFDLNMHSADRIVPEWQQLEIGEVLRAAARIGPGCALRSWNPSGFSAAAPSRTKGCGPSRSSRRTARPGCLVAPDRDDGRSRGGSGWE
jgi:hypothetical protein